jgi:hypothetical protein
MGGARTAPYADVLDAWRTSCPRLTVWEDAEERGLVTRRSTAGDGVMVLATDAGRELLRTHGRGRRASKK